MNLLAPYVQQPKLSERLRELHKTLLLEVYPDWVTDELDHCATEAQALESQEAGMTDDEIIRAGDELAAHNHCQCYISNTGVKMHDGGTGPHGVGMGECSWCSDRKAWDRAKLSVGQGEKRDE